jgi:hydroxymethylpyrimidine/phosphomethylpyrimidine kinase
LGAPVVVVPTVVLTVAGSDSSGGAGIEADLRTFSSEGVWGAVALTAVTAQSSRGLVSSTLVPPPAVADQIRATVGEMEVFAAKTGMLGSAETVAVVAAELERAGIDHVVVDPVIRSSSGSTLLDLEGIEELRARLLPLCSLVTPNIPEAETILGHSIETPTDMEAAAAELVELGARSVLLKGGHLRSSRSPDLLAHAGGLHWLDEARLAVPDARGTGCVLSSSIAAQLALGSDVLQACRHAKAVVTEAINAPVIVGAGQHMLWPRLQAGPAAASR